MLTAGGDVLASVDADELASSLQSGGPSPLVDRLASLLDARVLGGVEVVEGGGEPSGRGLGARVRGWLRGRG